MNGREPGSNKIVVNWLRPVLRTFTSLTRSWTRRSGLAAAAARSARSGRAQPTQLLGMERGLLGHGAFRGAFIDCARQILRER
ncbi:MAG: hypothetical protein KIT60_15045 [Burkholderiaceae bacterium]|nr:hypothetical protein [Burkholderiaceae bacterium]